MSGHNRVWAQSYLGTIVSGHNRVWAQMYMFLPRHDCDHMIITCLGTIVSGHNRIWAQSCLGTIVSGHNRVGSSMYGHNRVVSVGTHLL